MITRMHPATREILRHFKYDHLSPALQEISKPICELANEMAEKLQGPELTAGLRKLLEAKDCLVRAAVPAVVTITVNATEHEVEGELDYGRIVQLAGLPMRGDYTVVYRAPDGQSGSIKGGGILMAVEGLILDVAHTGSA